MTGASTAARIAIHLNGQPASVSATTLTAALDELGFSGQKVATALNGAFVPATARAAQTIQAGDKIEVVSARQGG
jgi:sulfur carrier protein